MVLDGRERATRPIHDRMMPVVRFLLFVDRSYGKLRKLYTVLAKMNIANFENAEG